MIITRSAHRLPADYDFEIIRTRVRARGPQWDAVPELYFEAFLLRESGRCGAAASSCTSLNLWRQNEPFRDFPAASADAPINSFTVVPGTFGRRQIQTRLPLDARRGAIQEARFVHTEEKDIPADADLPTVFADEAARSRRATEHPGAVAGGACQTLHLARPLFDTLPQGAAP